MTDVNEVEFAKIHTLNIPWLDSPFLETLLAESDLDEESKKLVKQFADKGYLIIDTEIEDFDRLADRIIKELEPHYVDPGRIQDAWTFNDAVRTIATAPKVLSILRLLYQREPIPFQTLNFPKGTEQGTHSDSIHFHCVPTGFMCGVWVALEDIDSNNGPLHYYPGSHKLPHFDLSILGFSGSFQQHTYEHYLIYEDFVQALINNYGLEKVEICLRKGQALIWAANLLHGGSPILDRTRSRHSQVTHFYFSSCMYYTPLLSDPFLKRIHLKNIKNIITGEVVKHFYNGREIKIVNGEGIVVETTNDELDKMRLQLYKAKAKVEQLKSALCAVESSKFWKLRQQWFKLKKALNLVKES